MKTGIVLAATACAAFLLSGAASAGVWTRHHPARTEIAHRAHFQQHRITHEYREGDLTKDQAHDLRGQVHDIHEEARSDALANGGHLTPDEVRSINRQQDAVGAEIPH